MLPIDWRPPKLTTPRLTLRPFSEVDAEPLFEYARNPNVTRFTLWEPHRNITETLTFVREYAALRYREGMAEPYAITLTPDPKPIGSCGCFWASRPNQSMELGYWLAEPFWGKGLAVEACRALVGHVFREYRPERVQARVIGGNVASSRVLDKLGFRFEGTLRSALFRREKFEDLLIYSFLREEWAEEEKQITSGGAG
jgi:[ribosomal protein S5]-alanine N-acetyltransferase